MIISASRRTDIPSFYFEWFLNRLADKSVFIRNPMNYKQISKINLSPEVVDGIVFWTKNPYLLIQSINQLKDYHYYIQFTLNAYARDIECHLPSKEDGLIPLFKQLSCLTSPLQVIWRYDPIFINKHYSEAYHLEHFEKLADNLHHYTKKVTFSFLESYKSIQKNMRALAVMEMTDEMKHRIAKKFAIVARKYGLAIDTCAQSNDFTPYGIGHAKCIDAQLFEKIAGTRLNVCKDKNQRLACGCASSIDIGFYNTCKNGCRYCYANHSLISVEKNYAAHNPNAPLLSGTMKATDMDFVKERVVKSNQIT